jgi:hypothetical protein
LMLKPLRGFLERSSSRPSRFSCFNLVSATTRRPP